MRRSSSLAIALIAIDEDGEVLHLVTHLARAGWLHWRKEMSAAPPSSRLPIVAPIRMARNGLRPFWAAKLAIRKTRNPTNCGTMYHMPFWAKTIPVSERVWAVMITPTSARPWATCSPCRRSSASCRIAPSSSSATARPDRRSRRGRKRSAHRRTGAARRALAQLLRRDEDEIGFAKEPLLVGREREE